MVKGCLQEKTAALSCDFESPIHLKQSQPGETLASTMSDAHVVQPELHPNTKNHKNKLKGQENFKEKM